MKYLKGQTLFFYLGKLLVVVGLVACTSQSNSEQSTTQENTQTAATNPAEPAKPADPAKAPEEPEVKYERLEGYTTSRKYVSFSAQSLEAWKTAIPEIQDIKVTSSKDGKKEPALFYTSKTEKKKPLLVVLHSWSDRYLQQASIPFALWAKKYDWAFIQPNFRGVFETPEAMGSDLAVQDIIDAVNYAKKHANIDTTRIYATGASGGGMASLLAVGRHPEIWAGIVSWVPVADINSWYQYNLKFPGRKYSRQIVAALQGNPLTSKEAAEKGKHRSAVTHIANAKDVPIYIAHGIKDELVPPDHALWAFNILVGPEEQFTPEHISYIFKNKKVPDDVKSKKFETYFGKDDPAVRFATESGNVRLVLFEGVHDMVYNPTLLWLSKQQKK